ncbi:MAG TPA: competence protein [Citreicella sp.]|jgi:competence protein ComEC|nr:competence protein [Citreicella sp.]
MGHGLGRIGTALEGQRGHLFPWVPVFLGVGIGVYFLWPSEPAVLLLALAGGAGVLPLLVQHRLPPGLAPLPVALGLALCGFALAGGRAHLVAGPQIDFRYYGPIEGRIAGIDRSASDAVRLVLDRVVLDMPPDRVPQRVRVALHGDQHQLDPQPGQRVILTGHLAAPGGAVEPGGFDFRRNAWFLRLGAVGYTRTPVLLLAEPEGGQLVLRSRMALSHRVQARLPGETGAFAAALVTGDRSAMSQATLEALRRSNLAHLLAISGLHMGLLAGFVFGALRVALLLVPHVRHYWPVKKIAAAAGLAAAAGYLALSGGNVATERAFVMVAVMLGAVMLDRRALSLRAVALAALIVLALRPEALLGPGFQMSFAATVALVAVFGALRDLGHERAVPGWARGAMSLLVSSLTASLATGPIAMVHFNLLSQYGLLANLVSVPVMGLLIMPMAVMAALLMPLGLDWIAFAVMAPGLDWILAVAQEVAGWQGASRQVVAPGPLVLPLLAAGGLMLALWQGHGRWTGLAPLLLAALLWSQTARPDLLIADTGGLVGLLTPQGRALSKAKGSGFAAETWLENDGQAGGQAEAAALWPGPPGPVARAGLGGLQVVHLQGKRAAAAFGGCTGGEIVVASTDLDDLPGCEIYDPERLARTGAVALWLTQDGARLRHAREGGARLWQDRRAPRSAEDQ